MSMTMMPRCGVPEIIGGRTGINSAGKYNVNYKFLTREPVLPLSDKELNWGLRAGTRRDIINPILNYSLVSWAGVAPLPFKFVDGNTSIADIVIGVLTGILIFEKAGELGISYKPPLEVVYLSGNVN